MEEDRMPIWITCPCSKRFFASDNQAGKKAECPQCGKTLRVPTDGGEAPHEPMPREEDEPVSADWRQHLPTKRREGGRCQVCDEPAKRKFHFYGAELHGVGEVERAPTGYRFSMKYKNVRRHALTLCPGCAAAAYRRALMPSVIVWAVLLVLPLVSVVVCLSLLPADARLVVLVVHGVVASGLAFVLAMRLLALARPDLKSATMAQAVVGIARRDRPDLGPHFFTVEQMRQMTGEEP
jgi:ssDNA-binding Zn-finger/Zn-ribbon topoisomerase 1